MFYAAPVWADAATTRSYTKGLTSTYRLCPLRVCSGFRTISDDAALFIAGMVQIDMFAAERLELYQALKCLQRSYGEVNIWLTQDISNYLYKFGHDDDPRCPECGVDETAEHVALNSPCFSVSRRKLLGELATADLIGRRLLEDAQFWAGMSSFAALTMKELRRLERNRAEARIA
ncbi:hypothetical protein KR074_002085 [Drosophila pseudoananassae]|nr:hypothetical protein KR074_002085 [Drosophila pseudoananassae]